MPNPYFQFKQFTVYHDRCAMKVGTDGVLLGAWADVAHASIGLDVGAGTGLISLMMAQRNSDIEIDAIDIDQDAVNQARDNVSESPFASRINCINSTFQSYQVLTDKKYDVIVSNPPFFTGSMKSPSHERTLARHNDTLPILDLIGISSVLLSDNGRLSLIYPYEFKEELVDVAKQNLLHPTHITNVYSTPFSFPKRVLIEFSKASLPAKENNLIIEKERHVYSDDFIALVKDFYLKM